MRLTHEKLMQLSANMPMKLIRVNDAPYLERYYAGKFADNWDLWLHHFCTNDPEPHLHSHPFIFKTAMLVGGYTEHLGGDDWRMTTPLADRMIDITIEKHLHRMRCAITECHKPHYEFMDECGHFNEVGYADWHRIAAVNVNTWTAVAINRERRETWQFKDDNGSITNKNSSPIDWWKDYKARPADGIVIGDNRKIN